MRSNTWEVVRNVNSCGSRCLQMIENAVPRWFCWVSRYISKYFNAMNRSWDSCPVSQNQV